ncbi:unnamed protein product [Sphagnum balticum]
MNSLNGGGAGLASPSMPSNVWQPSTMINDLSNPQQPVVTMLSPRANTSGVVDLIGSSVDRPDTVIIGFSAAPNYRYSNPYMVNIRTGDIRKMFTNKRFTQLYFDGDLKLRFGYEIRGDDTECYWLYNNNAPINRTTSWTIEEEDVRNTYLLGFDKTNTRLTPRLATFVFAGNDTLLEYDWSAMYPVVIRTRDALQELCYLSVPREVDAGNNGRTTRPVPLLLYVHGGPALRDYWGFDPFVQWMANRGYAVMQVLLYSAIDYLWLQCNFRGISYGGYATLVGLTFTPDVFQCGINADGPANLVTQLETEDDNDIDIWTRRIGGDVETDEERVWFARFRLATCSTSVLLADNFVAALKRNNIPVTYMVYPDEGHFVTLPANVISFFATAEQFFADCMGGRMEPMDERVMNASYVQVIENAYRG